jgi:hypothetical protein
MERDVRRKRKLFLGDDHNMADWSEGRTPPPADEAPVWEGRPPRPDSRGSYLTQAYFRPLFGSSEAIKQLFASEGFGNYPYIRLHDKFGFVGFETLAEAQLFVEHFNGFPTGNTQLVVELSSRRVQVHPPCRRLYVTGYDPVAVGERDLYWEAAPEGFVRHIGFRHDFAFIDFDTIDDAAKALQALNKRTLKGKVLAVAYARAAPPTDFTSLTIPLASILPRNHQFWAELAEKLQVR